jgi:hypothetical protein
MKINKKVEAIILVVIFLVILGLWSPWNNWDINILNLFGIDSSEKFATLKVKSIQGTISIYVDDELKGSASDNSEFAEINPITPGEHTITLKRENNGNYYQFVRKVDFEPGLDVVLAYDLGPSQYFSEGHILYTRKNFLKSNNPSLSVYSSPEDVSVYMDDILVGTTVIKDLELDKKIQHKLRFEKKGYDTMEITILPENIVDREKLSNYDIILEVNLFLQPVKINTQ